MKQPPKLEWIILDSLANDTECVATVYHYIKEELPDILGRKLKEVLYHLYERGLVYIEGEITPVERDEILAEEITNEYSIGKYYFGLTPVGVKYWEEASAIYNEPIDWSESWKASYDFKKREGYIDGTSLEVCLKELNGWNEKAYGEFKEWQVDMDSLVHSIIEGFQAKYYKYISGGHRVSFRLKRR